MEAYKSLPEGTLAELIDNAIYMSPSPKFKHQKALQAISFRLQEAVVSTELGEVIVAPFDVYLDETSNAVQPDIIVVLEENLSILDPEGHIHGVPDLLVEILSPGNKDHDLVRKKDLYEKFGVKEYWIVDPEDKKTIGYSFSNGKYELISEITGEINSRLLDIRIKF